MTFIHNHREQNKSLADFSQILSLISQRNICEYKPMWTRDVNKCVFISQQITAPSSTPLIDAVTPSPGTPNAVGVLTNSYDSKIDSIQSSSQVVLW